MSPIQSTQSIEKMNFIFHFKIKRKNKRKFKFKKKINFVENSICTQLNRTTP
jgi:hypothetical protein